jgi:hypothetical protein
MKRWFVASVLTLVLALGLMTAFAGPVHADSTGNRGQPSQSCQTLEGTTAPLSPAGFNTDGFNNIATQRYAGSAPQNSSNPRSVSQYDVACFQSVNH